MKINRIFSTIITIVIFLISLNLKAQVLYTKSDTFHLKQDSVVLKVNDFRGDVQWQFSKDMQSWKDIPNANLDSLFIGPIDSSGFYRAKITDGNCEPVFSDSLRLLVNLNNLEGNIYIPENLKHENIIIRSGLNEVVPNEDGSFEIEATELIEAIDKLTGNVIYYALNPEYFERLKDNNLKSAQDFTLKSADAFYSYNFTLDNQSTAEYFVYAAVSSMFVGILPTYVAYSGAYEFVKSHQTELSNFKEALDENLIKEGNLLINDVEDIFNTTMENLAGCLISVTEELSGWDIKVDFQINNSFDYANEHSWFEPNYSEKYELYLDVKHMYKTDHNKWEMDLDVYNGKPYFLGLQVVNDAYSADYESDNYNLINPFKTLDFVGKFTSCSEIVKTVNARVGQLAQGFSDKTVNVIKNESAVTNVKIEISEDKSNLLFYTQKVSMNIFVREFIHAGYGFVSTLINGVIELVKEKAKIDSPKNSKSIKNTEDIVLDILINKFLQADGISANTIDAFNEWSTNKNMVTLSKVQASIFKDFNNYIKESSGSILKALVTQEVKQYFSNLGYNITEDIISEGFSAKKEVFDRIIKLFKEGSKVVASAIDLVTTYLYQNNMLDIYGSVSVPVRIIAFPDVYISGEPDNVSTLSDLVLEFDQPVRFATNEEIGNENINIVLLQGESVIKTIEKEDITFSNENKTVRIFMNTGNVLQINNDYSILVKYGFFRTKKNGMAHLDIYKEFSVKKKDVNPPVLTTFPLSNLTSTSVFSGGIITNQGSSPVISRGICYSTNSIPTIMNEVTVDGNGIGEFESHLIGLKPNTAYNMRAYASNSEDVGYGEMISFTTLPASTEPLLSITSISDKTETTAIVHANVISNGGAAITERGICWNTTGNPSIENGDKIKEGSGLGEFTVELTGLQSNILYYVKAYAKNSIGIAYSDQFDFKTIDGDPVVINISPTKISQGVEQSFEVSGTNLPQTLSLWIDGIMTGEETPTSYTSTLVTFTKMIPYSYEIGGNTAYQIKASLSSSSILKSGNISVGTLTPSVSDFSPTKVSRGKQVTFEIIGESLVESVSLWIDGILAGNEPQSTYSRTKITYEVQIPDADWVVGTKNYQIKPVAGSSSVLKSGTITVEGSGPIVSSVTPLEASLGVETTFTVSGSNLIDGMAYYLADLEGITEVTGGTATTRQFKGIPGNTSGIKNGVIKDAPGGNILKEFQVTFIQGQTKPTVTTAFITNKTQISATCGGNVTSDGGAAVTARGVCWNTAGSPTITDSKTTDGSGTGSFISSIAGLNANTTYYVRSYATNSVGTEYGEVVSFITLTNEVFKGSLYINVDSQIDDFKKAGYKRITGNLEIFGVGVTKLDSFINLTKVDGHVEIYNCTNLKSFQGLNNLNEIADYLAIRISPAKDLNGLNGLVKIGSYFELISVGIKSFNGLDMLSDLESLRIGEYTALTSLAGAYSLSTIKNLYIKKNNIYLKQLMPTNDLIITEVLELDGCSLESLNGISFNGEIHQVSIKNTSSLTDLSSLLQLKKVNYDLVIESNKAITDLNGLQQITAMAYMGIYYNDLLTSINIQKLSSCISVTMDGNPNLNEVKFSENVSGEISCLRNPKLASIEASAESFELRELAELTTLNITCTSGLTIHGCPILTSLSGVKINPAYDKVFIDIQFNDNLSNFCPLSDVYLDFYQKPGVIFNISNNTLSGWYPDFVNGDCSE